MLDGNLFMMCQALNRAGLRPVPAGYHLRLCRQEELPLWMSMHFDDQATARAQRPYMERFFADVYAPHGDLFFKRCIMLCDRSDRPVGTCFHWTAYESVSTLHWFKVRRDCEGRGLGRALLSAVLLAVPPEGYPVYLPRSLEATGPSSCTAMRGLRCSPIL